MFEDMGEIRYNRREKTENCAVEKFSPFTRY